MLFTYETDKREPWILTNSGEQHRRAVDPLVGAPHPDPTPIETLFSLGTVVMPGPLKFIENGNQLAHC